MRRASPKSDVSPSFYSGSARQKQIRIAWCELRILQTLRLLNIAISATQIVNVGRLNYSLSYMKAGITICMNLDAERAAAFHAIAHCHHFLGHEYVALITFR